MLELTQGIRRAAALYPDRCALLFGERRRTWGELADRVARLAGAFRALGLGAGERIAMLAGNSDRYLEFYFATLWAGGVMVPLNVRWSMHELAACLDDCAPRILIADAENLDSARALTGNASAVQHVVAAVDTPAAGTLDFETLIAETAPVADARRADEMLACLFYTGGTTGTSKGVMLSHRNLMTNSMTALANMSISGDSVHLHVSPMFHVAGGARLFSLTVAGGTHAVIERFEPEAFLAAIERYRVTITVIVPTMLNRLLEHPALERYDLSSLELLSYGASPMPEALLRRAMARLSGVRFLQSYGMTELSPVATVLAPRYHVFDGPDAGYTRSAGTPVFNCEVAIHGRDDEPLPCREVGEVCVRGPMVMQGSWRREAETAEALRGGWMHTGDLGYLDARGFLFLVDRVKDMIVTGGENVYSAEVENVLHLHGAVRECAVIGVPSPEWGEAVHAIVVPKAGAAVGERELIDFCRARIARYKCPKHVEIRTEELPKTGPGKILKSALRAPYWQERERRIDQ